MCLVGEVHATLRNSHVEGHESLDINASFRDRDIFFGICTGHGEEFQCCGGT